MLALQSEIAQRDCRGNSAALWVATDPPWHGGASARVNSYEAYDLYLRGRYFWNKRTAEGFEQAIHYFQQAIAKDPGYAHAYAGLADCYVLMSLLRRPAGGVYAASPGRSAEGSGTG